MDARGGCAMTNIERHDEVVGVRNEANDAPTAQFLPRRAALSSLANVTSGPRYSLSREQRRFLSPKAYKLYGILEPRGERAECGEFVTTYDTLAFEMRASRTAFYQALK